MKEKIDELNLISVKNFYFYERQTSRERADKPQMGERFAKDIFDKTLFSTNNKIYK